VVDLLKCSIQVIFGYLHRRSSHCQCYHSFPIVVLLVYISFSVGWCRSSCHRGVLLLTLSFAFVGFGAPFLTLPPCIFGFQFEFFVRFTATCIPCRQSAFRPRATSIETLSESCRLNSNRSGNVSVWGASGIFVL
jgi:hypothetical protein